MEMINLDNYIRTNSFLYDLEKENVDLVVFEKFDDNYDIDVNNFSFDIIELEKEIKKWNSIDSVLSFYAKKNNKILLILDSLSLKQLYWILYDDTLNISVINLNTGLFGFAKKNYIDFDDITKCLDLWFEVFEPYDKQSLVDVLQKENSRKYIKVSNIDTVDNVFVKIKDLESEEVEYQKYDRKDLDKVFLMDFLWYTWNSWVLMFFGSYISTAIQTWQILYQNGFSM